jgi:hypothetical protein
MCAETVTALEASRSARIFHTNCLKAGRCVRSLRGLCLYSSLGTAKKSRVSQTQLAQVLCPQHRRRFLFILIFLLFGRVVAQFFNGSASVLILFAIIVNDSKRRALILTATSGS